MLEEASGLVASTLNKPENYVIVKINAGKAMACGGHAHRLGALIEMKSVGYGDKKAELAKKLTDFAVKYFKAEGPLVGIHFVDMPPANVAHNGRLMG